MVATLQAMTPREPMSTGALVAVVIAMLVWLGVYSGARATRRRRGSTAGILDRYVPDHISLLGAAEQELSFSLTPVERAMVGVRGTDDEVIFGPSGAQWASALLWVAGSIIGLIVALVVSADRVLVGAIVAAVVCAVIWAALLPRVEVRLDNVGLVVRGRVGGERLLRWTDVEEVAVEVFESGFRMRGAREGATIAEGVVRASGGRWVALPGFRSRMWGADKLRDPLNAVDAKIAIVVRYRRSTIERSG